MERQMHNQSDFGYSTGALSSRCIACGSYELDCCDGTMPDAATRNSHVAEPFRSILNTALAVREEPAPDEPSGMFRDHSCWKCQDGKKACVRGAPYRCEYPHARND
jgi:hypothetical protein